VSPRRKTTSDAGLRGKVRAHDPFELIRWLALSQPDPRKALAELVQNSLDAGARRVRVTRVRIRGVPCLRVLDDGEGVIPELDRAEALRFIATHIGHSRKRNLSPQERLQAMTQGQYGIGLLGFWSLGERLEMRSATPDGQAHHLILHRDRPDYLIEPLRGRLPLGERWTEIVVIGLHKGAMPLLAARRAADYLAAELRGQLLARQVELVFEDRMARGRAQKVVAVRPHRFLGDRLAVPELVPVPGHADVRLELYVRAGGAGAPVEDQTETLAVYSAGTVVAQGFAELAALGLDHHPWTDARLVGLVDYPEFTVAPGSRRGVLLDAKAVALAAALRGVEPQLVTALAELDRRRAEELDRAMVRDLQRAFRDLLRSNPRYEMLPVAREESERTGSAAAETVDRPAPAGFPEVPVDALPPPDAETPDTGDASAAGPPIEPGQADLFPPGPLHHVTIAPSRLRLPCGARRAATCEPRDASGRLLDRDVTITWSVAGAAIALEPPDADVRVITLTAGDEPCAGWLRVHVREGDAAAESEIPFEVVEVLGPSRSGEGIPAPVLVEEPGAAWRSRWNDGRWEVNAAHRDYRAAAARPAVKLRYLAALFAKEIVLRGSGDPRLAAPLEQLVEVFSFADRRLGPRGARRSAREPADEE